MKYLKWFIVIISQFALVELVLWIHTSGFGWHVSELAPSDAISLWGTVTTIVFLVFSVLALWNIDQKIQELNEMKRNIGEKFNSIETKNHEVMLEANKAQRNIVKKAEEQIKLILDKSTYRQNYYDALTRIANILDPSSRVLEYTTFLRTSNNVEGVNYAYVYICRGDAYLSLSRFDKALADYEMAAKLDTTTTAPYFALGNYYVTRKDFKKSIEVYEEGLKIEPQNDNLLMNLANSFSALGEYEKADEYYDKALTFNPDLVMAYYNKAKRVLDKKEGAWKELSMTYLNHCIEIMPYFYKANINKASLLREESKNDEAIEVLTKVIEATYNLDYIMAVLQRGIAYRLVGKMPQALNDFNTVLSFQPHNVQNLSNLSCTHYSMGHINEAEYFAQIGLDEAKTQNQHDCDAEFNEVIRRINAIKHTISSTNMGEQQN
jgi:tetratricopeptide (TPR) repeat protein